MLFSGDKVGFVFCYAQCVERRSTLNKRLIKKKVHHQELFKNPNTLSLFTDAKLRKASDKVLQRIAFQMFAKKLLAA